MSIYTFNLESKSADIVSDVLVLDTHHPIERFTFHWQVSNFSIIRNRIKVDFATASESTAWTVELDVTHPKYSTISLARNFDGEPIRIQYEAKVRTCHKTIEGTGKHEFLARESVPLLHISLEEENFYVDSSKVGYHQVKFTDDVMKLECTMLIAGHVITSRRFQPRSLESNVSWSPTSNQLVVDLQNLLQSEEYCDLVVSVDNRKMSVHKAILCARSSVFSMMFRHDMMENKNQEVVVDDIDFETLKDFIHFLYSCDVKTLTWDKAMKLYYAADKYDVKDLRKVCAQFFRLNMTVERASEVLKLAYQHKDEELKQFAMHFTLMRLRYVESTDGWKDLFRTLPKLVVELKTRSGRLL